MKRIEKSLWVPDNEAFSCFYCNAKFNAFRRKHHCRLCGSVFCGSCCEKRAIEHEKFRVCISCNTLNIGTKKRIIEIQSAEAPEVVQPKIEKEVTFLDTNGDVFAAIKTGAGIRKSVTNHKSVFNSREYFDRKLPEIVQKDTISNLLSKAVSLIEDPKKVHIKTVLNSDYNLEVYENTILGSQTSITPIENKSFGRVLFVANSIQPNVETVTNFNQINQENYRLNRCAERFEIEGVKLVVIHGTCAWTFKSFLLESLKTDYLPAIILCPKYDQFLKLQKLTGCLKPLSHLTDILADPFDERCFGVIQKFSHHWVDDRKMFKIVLNNAEVKTIIISGPDLDVLKWSKRILKDFAWIIYNEKGLSYFANPDSTKRDAFMIERFEIPNLEHVKFADLSLNRSKLIFDDMFTKKECTNKILYNDVDNFQEILHKGLYKNELAEKWKYDATESIRRVKLDCLESLPYTYFETVVIDASICKRRKISTKPYLNSDTFENFATTMIEKSLKPCEMCKRQFYKHRFYFDHAEYRILVAYEIIDLDIASIYVTCKNDLEKSIHEVGSKSSLLGLALPVVFDNLNDDSELIVYANNVKISLMKIKVCTKEITYSNIGNVSIDFEKNEEMKFEKIGWCVAQALKYARNDEFLTTQDLMTY